METQGPVNFGLPVFAQRWLSLAHHSGAVEEIPEERGPQTGCGMSLNTGQKNRDLEESIPSQRPGYMIGTRSEGKPVVGLTTRSTKGIVLTSGFLNVGKRDVGDELYQFG